MRNYKLYILDLTATYDDYVNALRGSLSHLEGFVSTLGTGVADFPRLVGVLKTYSYNNNPEFFNEYYNSKGKNKKRGTIKINTAQLSEKARLKARVV
ncbi:uncharacterized protein PG986_011652 [Apiospora aurea]|uniref:Uncharacterized protein n=1 Tax=Apiospora aurea TaxID=335848 RepID=A0ABR1PXR0_9PEZI